MRYEDDLATLFHRRWAVPVLAELARARGAKFVTLARRLGTTPGSIRHALDHLIELGLVRRNPGYGHPLRPEYLVTTDGASLAPACQRLLEALREGELQDVGLRKWSMPVLLALDETALRFGEIRSRLGSVTARALTRTLKDLVTAGLVDRSVTDEFPPAARYIARGEARSLVGALREIRRCCSLSRKPVAD